MAEDSKSKAKRIIVEIIRQAGGRFTNKTNLYKAFYYAHLRYAEVHPGYLSTWPIVRMPRGPGIDRFDVLLGELMAEARVETKQIDWGERTGFQFRLCGETAAEGTELANEAVDAIAFAVNLVTGMSANAVSDLSHSDSRSWRLGQDGEELNIYTDALSEKEFERRMARAKALTPELN